MKIHRVPVSMRWSLAAVLALPLWIGQAGATAVLDKRLIEAAQAGDPALIQSLLETGARVNAVDDAGRTALMEASRTERLEILRLLLEKRADVNAKDHNGWTALMFAVWEGRLASVRLLLDSGADINVRGKNGETALEEAVRNDRTEMTKLLLSRGAEATDGALRWGVWRGRPEMVKLLLVNGADANAKTRNGRTVLMEAAARNHQLEPWYSRLRYLLPILLGGPPLGPLCPSGKSDPEIVKLLLESGADVTAMDQDGWTALKRAQHRGSTEIVELLRAHGAKK